MPNTGDYLFVDNTLDWAKVMNNWEGLTPEAFTIYLVNRFGDAFLVDLDGAVHMLDIGACNCKKVARSKGQFVALLNEHFGNWLMVNATDACVQHGMTLGQGECYGYKVPPFLGGKIDLGNIYVTKLADYHQKMGRIYQKIKDLPDGTTVQMVGE
ncbi:T6SS immunity protein Tdi1 domain-containing protein [Aquisalinus flavus]|uniref:T6SS immunity protein Tdi1 C-terminal domain-containing protein n=1 Tax=Aquisalinus flavus TaxID=1526572 RepID=A0A8J2Y4S4_9PROT|nr:T6SS immunity protein Tdi1 domain-containing protein [Aquisalinus flavus]MBD0427487.1 DUF1851 domain-containing protein [Aquisalinus flavus]UNE47282.1 DUF1851 domain-containing protein [Aquisalinus flavus]GGD01382.1 hypothetical protein GCM10011342_08000 [Aquisalinus flavus]